MENAYAISGGYYFETLEAAVKEASRRAADRQRDYTIYKAVKIVSPKAPEVDISDIA